jgi:hypothetical protein
VTAEGSVGVASAEEAVATTLVRHDAYLIQHYVHGIPGVGG